MLELGGPCPDSLHRLRAGSWRGRGGAGRWRVRELRATVLQTWRLKGQALACGCWTLGTRVRGASRFASWREPPPAAVGALRRGARGLAFISVSSPLSLCPLLSQGHRSYGLGRTLMTSCNLDYLFDGGVSRTASPTVGQGVTARMPRAHNSASDTGQGWWHEEKLVSIVDRERSPGAGYCCLARRGSAGHPLRA